MAAMMNSKHNCHFTSYSEIFFACIFSIIALVADTVLSVSVFAFSVVLLVVVLLIFVEVIITRQNLITSPDR